MDTTQKEELKGIGGWLLLLIVILLFIGPLRGAWSIHSELQALAASDRELYNSAEWDEIVITSWLVWAVGITFTIVSGFILFLWRRWRAVKVAIAFMWLGGPILTLIVLLDALYVGAGLNARHYIELVQPFGFCIIWTSYLLLSERVKNTYPQSNSGEPETEIREV